MGKNKRKQKRERENKSKVAQSGPYEDCPRFNKEFETYYKIQKICPEEEWEKFLNAIQSELPTAFRITSSRDESKVLLQIVQGNYFSKIVNVADEDKSKAPFPLPWYPENFAWQLPLTRRQIRRSEEYFPLHNFLISETASGNISRQEVVSMIPPIVLDIKPHHKVLDMCAAPGSKTAQLIESLHRDEGRIPAGFVVANDVDNARCYMLVHQTKRLSSPNLIVINHDATVLPNLYMKNKVGDQELVQFDRILCDVPCTGDGTLRKNPDIWPKWNTANGSNLHGIQYRIVKRGCEMLAEGGRLVYSTCSLNPIENEAVLTRLLLEADGSLETVDASPLLPGLTYSKGLTTWTPTSRDLVTYGSPDEVPDMWQSCIRSSMFPPTPEQAEKLRLDLCIRVLPHHQDTGGFFVAVLEKKKPLPWESAKKGVTVLLGDNNEAVTKPKEPARKKRRIFGYKEDPFIFFEPDEPLWPEIKEFYDINNDFPSDCLLTRCKEGKKKNIYLTSAQVRDIVLQNAERVKIINTGVKVFSRCDNKEMKCNFRLVQEGLWSIFQFIGKKRQVVVPRDDILKLLACDDLKKPPLTSSLSSDVQSKISEIGQGSCILTHRDERNSMNLVIVGWVGAISTRGYIPLSDCVHYLRLLGGDTTKFEINKFKKIDEEEVKTSEEPPVNEETIEAVSEEL